MRGICIWVRSWWIQKPGKALRTFRMSARVLEKARHLLRLTATCGLRPACRTGRKWPRTNTAKNGPQSASGSSWGNQMVDTKDFSTILSGLLNDFPAIGAREIRFGELGDKSGVGIYPSAAATVISETTDIMGGVYQKCNYAFMVVYRAVPQSETDRIHIKGWLDKLARWLEKQPITADGQQHTLAAWPDLGGGRTITAFVQVSAAYLAGRYPDGVEDWAVSLSMRYDNNFER
nr:MAG TPA: Minor capsid protein from bacteriophage [Caudoviricetes sp.]